MLLLYRLLLSIYHAAIKVASLANEKAKKWHVGRKNWRKELALERDLLKNGLWMHCASLGEFEQGRPLLEKIRKEQAHLPILLTFYSPSGFEVRKNYKHVDKVMYLPEDTPSNARDFIQLLSPRLVLFVKYEFWLFYLQELSHQNIPHFLIAASFRSEQIFFKWYGGIFKKALQQYTHLFTQTPQDIILLNNLGIYQATAVGDPRIDRVLETARYAPSLPIIENFTHQKRTLIIGSAWKNELSFLNKFLSDYPTVYPKVIIAPHEVDASTINRIQEDFPHALLYTNLDKNAKLSNHKLMIVNTIGLLSTLYQYGHVAIIGGGFGKGIHNILEPMAFKLAVVFGPNHSKFPEAKETLQRKGSFEINNYKQFEKTLLKLAKKENYQRAGQTNFEMLKENQGATETIYKSLIPYLEENKDY